MGLLRNIFDFFSTLKISDEFGLGAGFLYADFAGEKASERELEEMKVGVSKEITEFIQENKRFLNPSLIQKLHSYMNNIANSNKYTAESCLNELKNFFTTECKYFMTVIEILNNTFKTLEAIPEDSFNDGIKQKSLEKIKETINCSDAIKMNEMLKNLFEFFSENGINVENKDEIYKKFDDARKEYLESSF